MSSMRNNKVQVMQDYNISTTCIMEKKLYSALTAQKKNINSNTFRNMKRQNINTHM